MHVACGAAYSGRAEFLGLLFTAFGRTAEWRMSELNAQDLSKTAWAFATVKPPDEKLFTALARAAERRVFEFNAQNLANTAWAFAAVNQADEKLFTALARAAERRVSEFNAQALANTAWTFATVKWPDEKLFTALARATERRVIDSNAQTFLSMTSWALSRCVSLTEAWSIFDNVKHISAIFSPCCLGVLPAECEQISMNVHFEAC